MKKHPLDFDLVDDLTLASPCSRGAVCEAVSSAYVEHIGPLVEYLFHQAARPDLLPSWSTCSPTLATSSLGATLDCGSFQRMPTNLCLDSKDAEFSWCPTNQEVLEDPRWIAFCKRFDKSAQRAGFSRAVSAGMTGAFGEMVDNVLAHSEKPDRAIVGYASAQNWFEYVVADAGIGVLESLRQNPDYGYLGDAGTALRTALTDGESRFGQGRGRGLGFRQVFVSLANLRGSLRFRSGDHGIEIDGTNPCLSKSRVLQRSYYQGLMVSVLCRC